jgi:leucyl/phenylalanyl-tRNA--protein transferase
MFSIVSNASKVAFHYLIKILKDNEFVLLDSQFMNDNVKRYGAIEIPKKKFDDILAFGIKKKCEFTLL